MQGPGKHTIGREADAATWPPMSYCVLSHHPACLPIKAAIWQPFLPWDGGRPCCRVNSWAALGTKKTKVTGLSDALELRASIEDNPVVSFEEEMPQNEMGEERLLHLFLLTYFLRSSSKCVGKVPRATGRGKQ